MRKFIILFICAFSACFTNNLFGQSDTLYLFLKDKTIQKYAVENIDSITFKTADPTLEKVTDIDGNEYNVVSVGNQKWLKENLRVTRYNDGTYLDYIEDEASWVIGSNPAYSWYQNDMTEGQVYGAIYNGATINSNKNICPQGWHVPTKEELEGMLEFLGGPYDAGGKLKEVGLAHWFAPNAAATDEFGFQALPGGMRSFNNGYYGRKGSYAYFWTSDIFEDFYAWFFSLYYNNGEAVKDYGSLKSGMSIRCIRDNQ